MADEPLDFVDDVRVKNPDQKYRRGRFKDGWNEAVAGKEYESETLEELTWQNLGWRLGKLFGETSEEMQEAMYDWCENQQIDS